MSVLVMRDAIVSRIRDVLPELVTVEPHDGEFTTSELDRFMRQLPRVVVVCRGLSSTRDTGGDVTRSYQWVALVIASDVTKPGAQRIAKGDIALRLSDRIARLAADERWNGVAADTARSITTRNLYSTALDRAGATFWSVSWTQSVDTSDELVDLDDLAPFECLHTDITVSGDDAPEIEGTTHLE